MRKNVYGRQFKRDINERKALFKSLLSELVLHERILTTVEKAKSIKSDADRLITKAKKPDKLHARILLSPMVNREALLKLLNELGPRFADRKGGYTRIVKLGRRFSDNASTAYIEWTETKVKLDKPSQPLTKLLPKPQTTTTKNATEETKISAAVDKKKKTSEKKVTKSQSVSKAKISKKKEETK